MWMSEYTGWKFSVGMVILSGIVGAWLAKRSWHAVGRKMRERMQPGGMSTDLLTDGAMIFFAAGLLLTPGFLTDTLGFSMLIPVCRGWYKARIGNWMKRNFKFQMVQMPPTGNDPNTVDGEVVSGGDDDAADSNATDSGGPKVIKSGELLP